MCLFGSKPIKMETLSNGDGVMCLYTPWPMGLETRREYSYVKMNLERGSNTGQRECR